MLIACPECERQVSDRSPACPACGFPIAEELAARRAADELSAERASRSAVGDTDCVACEARGFVMVKYTDEQTGEQRDSFYWCEICEHAGRVALVHSRAGYWAVRRSRLDAFVTGDIDAHETDAVRVGDAAPEPRYPTRNDD